MRHRQPKNHPPNKPLPMRGRAERDKRKKEDQTESKVFAWAEPNATSEKKKIEPKPRAAGGEIPRSVGRGRWDRRVRTGTGVPFRRAGAAFLSFFLRERRATGVGEELAGGGVGGLVGRAESEPGGGRDLYCPPLARSPSRRAYLDFGGSAAVARACPLASDHVRGADRCHGGAYASPLLCRLSTRCAPRVALSRRRALKRQVIGGSKPRSCVRRNRAATRLVRTSSPPRRGVASYGTARGISAPGLVVRRIRNGHGTPQHAKL
jgi:hypothetical protein